MQATVHNIPDSYLRDYPNDPLTIVVSWLKEQSQDVWAALVFGFDGRTDQEEDLALFWLVDQPGLGQGSAVRLFWRLFDADVHAGAAPAEGVQAMRLSACQVLARNLDAGVYSEDDIEVAIEDVDQFKRYVSVESINDRYTIPQAALTPRTGYRPWAQVAGTNLKSAEILKPFLYRYRISFEPRILERRRANMTATFIASACVLVVMGAFTKAVADQKALDMMMMMLGEIC